MSFFQEANFSKDKRQILDMKISKFLPFVMPLICFLGFKNFACLCFWIIFMDDKVRVHVKKTKFLQQQCVQKNSEVGPESEEDT